MKTTRLLAGICALTLVFSGVAGGVPSSGFMFRASALVEYETSGQIGQNLTWTLDEGGTLTVSGEGEWEEGEKIPAKTLAATGSIVIERGITSIGEFAFASEMGCSIMAVNIPNTVSKIGQYAFKGCKFETVTIPDSITVIEQGVFSNCENLAYIVIPSSVTRIGNSAFCGCSTMTDITIPESVICVDQFAFCACENLHSVTFLNPYCEVYDSEVTISNEDPYCPCEDLRYRGIIRGYENSTAQAYADKYGYTFESFFPSAKIVEKGNLGDNLTWTLDADGTLTISGEGAWKNGERIPAETMSMVYGSIIIQDGITSIGDEAFSIVANEAFSVEIPNSVKTIGKFAFSGCALESVTIPESVTAIEKGVFYNCGQLAAITLPDSITSIGDDAFCACRNLNAVTIPASVTSIGAAAFCACDRLHAVTILNPDCEIFDSEVTISNEDPYCPCEDLRYRGIIRGYENSTAQAYADKYGYTFESFFPSAKIVEKGNLGDNLKWTLDENGGLTVSGEGEWAQDAYLPVELRGQIKSVVIADGVTSIGTAAFRQCGNLTEVTISDSVRTIGDQAFDRCSALASLTIGEGVTDIERLAFNKCCGLTAVTIPGSVKRIGGGAFEECEALTSVTIGEGTETIENSAFEDCTNLAEISIPESVTAIGPRALDNTAWMTAKRAENPLVIVNHILIDGKTAEGDIVIPDGTTRIAYSAFSQAAGLTGVTIPDSVTAIEAYAFSSCKALTEAVIPDSVNEIGEHAFHGCSALASVTLPETCKLGSNVFTGTAWLAALQEENVLVILNNVLIDGKEASGDIVIPDGVTRIGESAFSNVLEGAMIESVVIPGCLTDIDDCAFSGCYCLVSLTISEGVKTIGAYAFSGCRSLKSITVPASVDYIGKGAFASEDQMQSITILNPDCVIYDDELTIANEHGDMPGMQYNGVIRGYAGSTAQAYAEKYGYTFEAIDDTSAGKISGECGINLTWTLDEEGTLTISGTGAMPNYALQGPMPPWYLDNREDIKKVVIADGVTSIGDYAFYECTELESITIPDSVTSIGNRAFENCAGLTSIVIPDGVTSIDYCAFAECENLTEITIPESVTNIGSAAFGSTPWLYAQREENPLVVVNGILIDGRTCSGSVTIPDDVTNIGDGAFIVCENLTSVTIPESVTSIGDDTFNNCLNLTSVTIPDSVTSIGGNAFYKTPWLKALQEENPFVIVNNILIDGQTCSGNITIPDNVTSISGKAFYVDTLTEVIIPESVTCIGGEAFVRCSALTSITFLTPNCEIFDHSKTICNDLKAASNNTIIGVYSGVIRGYAGSTAQAYAEKYGYTFEAIDDTSAGKISGECGINLTWTLDEEGTLTISGTGAMTDDIAAWYDHKADIKKIVIEDGVSSIGDKAFHECSALESITIPDSVTSIGIGAFGRCKSLTNIVIPDGVTSIGDATFYGCHSLTSIVIPDGVTSIGNHAFRNCTGLTSIVIPDSVTSIGSGAFDDYNIDDNARPPRTEDLTIKGYAGSYAETYANENGISFEVIEDVSDPCPDMNNDGQITASDAQTILLACAELLADNPSGLTPEQEAAADVDGSGGITALDAQYTLTYYLYNTVLDQPMTWYEILHLNE